MRVALEVEVLQRLDALLERAAAQRCGDGGGAIIGDALEHPLGGLGAQLVGHRVDERDVEQVVVFRKQMIAGFGEAVARRRPAGAPALLAARDPRLHPSLALQLQQLLPHRFAGQRQQLGELRDGGGPLGLERDENRAATIGQLVDGDDGEPS